MKTRIVATLLASLFALTAFLTVSASAVVDGAWEYEFTDGKAIITRYNGSAATLTIPDNFKGCPVTEIEGYAFFNCLTLKKISIPGSVRVIGSSAFADCRSLTNVTISAGLKEIGHAAFYDCVSLKSLVIPNTVIEIGDYAFSGCNSLTGITIPSGVKAIDYATFNDCTSLKTIAIPNSVKTIAGSAFFRCPALRTLLYGGSEAQWNKLSIDQDNDLQLLREIIIFNATPGDVNGDGSIDAKDIIAVMKHILGKTPNSFGAKTADMNADDKIDAKDIILIMKMTLGAR